MLKAKIVATVSLLMVMLQALMYFFVPRQAWYSFPQPFALIRDIAVIIFIFTIFWWQIIASELPPWVRAVFKTYLKTTLVLFFISVGCMAIEYILGLNYGAKLFNVKGLGGLFLIAVWFFSTWRAWTSAYW
ncbi:hypothetical protein C4546_01045 [Candidatus Parcubacteria bacterium]|jgi:hypothetical protein|nr:MAG: hypothetical protein C4546_01045 [Candidatus Parcubacteria bacterium]